MLGLCGRKQRAATVQEVGVPFYFLFDGGNEEGFIKYG